MLRNDWQRKICADYGAQGKDGKVRCRECPLNLPQIAPYGTCQANHHYDRKKGEWVADER